MRNIGSGNPTGHIAKAGCIARAVNAVRVAPRATDVARAGHAVSMRHRNQECGRPNGDGVQIRGAAKKIGPASCLVAVCTAMSR